MVEIKVDKQILEVEIYSGAARSMMPREVFNKFFEKDYKLKESSVRLL